MKDTNAVDIARKITGIRSDYAVASTLGMSRQAVSNIRHGRSKFSDSAIIKLAESAQTDPTELYAAIHAAQADDLTAPIWHQLAKMARGASHALPAILCAAMVTASIPALSTAVECILC